MTIAEICKEAKISNSTCRRYISEFDDFFRTRGGSRVKKYEEQAVNVIKRIKYLYDEGKDKEEIYNVLANEFSMIISDEEEKENTEAIPGLATGEDMAEIKESLEEQKKFNAELINRLDQQSDYIKKSIEKRDQALMQTMNEMMESKKQIAVEEQQQEKKKGFFGKLFGRNDN